MLAAAYPSILCCLGVAAGMEQNILAVTPLKMRTGSTWTGFPSTLLLQLLFVPEIKCKEGEAGQRKLVQWREVFFELLGSILYFTVSVRIFVQCLRKYHLPVCRNPALQYPLPQSAAGLSHRCTYRQIAHMTYAVMSTPAHAPTYTHIPCLLECNHGNGAPAQKGLWWRKQRKKKRETNRRKCIHLYSPTQYRS